MMPPYLRKRKLQKQLKRMRRMKRLRKLLLQENLGLLKKKVNKLYRGRLRFQLRSSKRLLQHHHLLTRMNHHLPKEVEVRNSLR